MAFLLLRFSAPLEPGPALEPKPPASQFGALGQIPGRETPTYPATGRQGIVREALRGGGRPFPVQLPGLAKSSLSQGRAPPALSPNGAFSSISAASSESSPGLLALTWPQEPLPHLGQTLCTLPPSTEGCRATTNPGLRGRLPQKKIKIT